MAVWRYVAQQMREFAESRRASPLKLLNDWMLMCEGRKVNGSVERTSPQSVVPRLEGERADQRVRQSRHCR